MQLKSNVSDGKHLELSGKKRIHAGAFLFQKVRTQCPKSAIRTGCKVGTSLPERTLATSQQPPERYLPQQTVPPNSRNPHKIFDFVRGGGAAK